MSVAHPLVVPGVEGPKGPGSPALEPHSYRPLVVDDDLAPGPASDVTVVVVTHESRAHIERCLESLDALPDDVGFDVLVVDNASTDGTPEVVAERFPWVRLIRKHARHGFSTNCNIGASVAGGRHILLLNPDTMVFPGALATLVAHAEAASDVGVVAPRLVYPDGEHQHSVRRFPTVRATLVRRTPLRWLLRDSVAERRQLMVGEEPTLVTDVDWALGAALLVPRDVFADLEGFDEGYRLYCEDIDLCWRVHELGLSVRYVPAAVVEHVLAEDTRKRFLTRRTWWHVRSMLRFVRLHGLGSPRTPEMSVTGSVIALPR